MSTLINVPNINDLSNGIGCSFNKESNSYEVYVTDHVGNRKLSMGNVCASTPESISNDIACLLIDMRKSGFEQGRKHVREALGLKQ